MLDKAANAGRAPLRDHVNDEYDTHPCAVHALLKIEQLPHRIWEPACGTGNIVRVLREAGHEVFATDINPRGCPKSRIINFLALRNEREWIQCNAIVTNPPYAIAEQFVELGLERVPLVILLLRLAFLESKRRSQLLDTGMLARVHVFANRLPMMHRNGWAGKRASSAIAFAWFVFDRDHHGPTTLDRIRWKPEL